MRLRLSALIWPRKTVWWHSCGRAFQKLENYDFICNTEQPRFIPTMPTVNNKTWMNKLNTTENTVSSILKELNISKPPGPDAICTRSRLLMELSDVICHPLLLCKIFETSLISKTCCIPDDWKDAQLSAIYTNRNTTLACTLPSKQSNMHSL